jgi:hypothetical protein
VIHHQKVTKTIALIGNAMIKNTDYIYMARCESMSLNQVADSISIYVDQDKLQSVTPPFAENLDALLMVSIMTQC